MLKGMKNKTFLFIPLLVFLGNSLLFSQEESVSVRDAALATGLAFTVNVFFNSADRIILNEDFAAVNPHSIKRNLTHRWWWDTDDFATNQFGHPYQGSLYFNAGRANGLDFFQSLALAGFGSLTWEEFGETDLPSMNDIITTPLCGAIFGEVFHRLYIDADALCPALAWIISPMDGLNNILTGRESNCYGRVEELDLLLKGGREYSRTDFSSSASYDEMMRYAGGGGVHIQYGKGIGHDTKEVFDTFTLDLDTSFSSNYYKADFSIDGFFWSHGLYFEESEGTFGVNLMYEGEWASNAVFSNAGLGIKYLYEKNFLDSGVRFTFFAQADNIFMGTRSLYSLYKRRSDFSDSSNPPRFYNFGYGALAKTGFSLGNSFWGTLYGEVSADFLLPFLGSEVKGARCKRNFMVEAKAGYEHMITRGCSLGISDNFTYKADRYRSEPDTVQVFNSFDVYAKVWFIR